MNRLLLLAVLCILALPLAAHCQQPMTQQQKDAAKEAGAAIAGVGLLGIICIGFSMLCFDLIPIGIALVRGHPDTVAISLITLLFGWTCIGWFVALIWSVKSFPRTSGGYARDY